MRFRMAVLSAVVVAACLSAPNVARAAPPPNDARAAAAVIPAFPATIAGTTVEATVERLDPQVSECGRVESTVWYRIDQAPDGTIVLGLQGRGFAPVLRVYELSRGGIDELVCDNAQAGRQAVVGFETDRGASYLVLVGKRPGTRDAAFALEARLYLPPANDTQRQARPIAKLPATVKGTTFGGTTDDGDPIGRCRLGFGTVWYKLAPGKAERIVLRLTALRDLDAVLVVQERIRSTTRPVTCDATDRKGQAVAAFSVREGASYQVVVGQRFGSPPGDFLLRVLPAQPAEKPPGTRLPLAGARSTVNGLTDVNDVWWTRMSPGKTYRVSLRSEGCASASLTGPVGELRSFTCNGYATFTPGPDGGGRYVFEVTAPRGERTSAYRLLVARAGPDDLGVGLPLGDLSVRRGSLDPTRLDVVDVYHFDVAQRSDVRLRLASARTRSFTIQLLTDTGDRVTSSDDEINRKLDRGRYVVAVRGEPGTPAGAYRLGLVVRQVTKTTLTASATEIVPGASVVLRIETTPVPETGWTEVQIDRFDPLTGWQFNRIVRVPGRGTQLTWRPPLPGRWRVRASFLGTLRSSPSRSGYVSILVATPLPEPAR